MQRKTDEQVAVALVEDHAQRYPEIASNSFDQGFHSQSINSSSPRSSTSRSCRRKEWEFLSGTK